MHAFLVSGLSRYEYDGELSLKIVSLLQNLTASGHNVSVLFTCGSGGGLLLLLQLMQTHASNELLVVKVFTLHGSCVVHARICVACVFDRY